MLHRIREMPWSLLVIASLTLGLAPFRPEPHVVEKLRMLGDGSLTAPVDIFDLVLHATPWVLLLLRGVAELAARERGQGNDAA